MALPVAENTAGTRTPARKVKPSGAGDSWQAKTPLLPNPVLTTSPCVAVAPDTARSNP